MPFTSLLDEIGAEEAIPDDLEDEADEAAEEDVGAEDPGPAPDPAQEIAVGDATEYSEDQFNDLTDIQFDEIMQVTVVDDGTEGSTEVGVRVTDHHGSFDETPTTANPATDPSEYSGNLGELQFENGSASFTVSGFAEDVDTDLVTFAFGSGLNNTNDIETIGVVVGGTDPDEPGVGVPDQLFVESLKTGSMTTATTSTEAAAGDTSGEPPYEDERDGPAFEKVEHIPDE